MEILKKPSLCKEVFKGMTHVDALVRMRSADVLEKVGRIQPKYLQPYKHGLMGEVAAIEQQEVRWHVAQMFSYLDLDKSERATAAKTLFSWIESSSDKSKIVKVSSIQALADFAKTDEELKPKVIEKLHEFIDFGSPAMASRSRKLLKKLE